MWQHSFFSIKNEVFNFIICHLSIVNVLGEFWNMKKLVHLSVIQYFHVKGINPTNIKNQILFWGSTPDNSKLSVVRETNNVVEEQMKWLSLWGFGLWTKNYQINELKEGNQLQRKRKEFHHLERRISSISFWILME